MCIICWSSGTNDVCSYVKASATASTSEAGWSPIRRADSGQRSRAELDTSTHITTRIRVGRGDKKKKPQDASDIRGSQTAYAGERHLPHEDNLPAYLQHSTLHTLEGGSSVRTFIHLGCLLQPWHRKAALWKKYTDFRITENRITIT